jgi:hypothetical protein
MWRVPPNVLLGLAALAVALALASQQPAPPPGQEASLEKRVEDTEQLLQGTWLREYTADGAKVRRVLVLAPDGGFREVARVVDATGGATEFVHEGTWLFDGTNLKRKYTMMNGKPPSRLNVPFATFEIRFETRNEFVGLDHIHRNRIEYRRVLPETLP